MKPPIEALFPPPEIVPLPTDGDCIVVEWRIRVELRKYVLEQVFQTCSSTETDLIHVMRIFEKYILEG